MAEIPTTLLCCVQEDTARFQKSCEIAQAQEQENEQGGGYDFTIDRCEMPEFDEIEFMACARRSMEIPNAGGSSNISEALSMEYLKKKFIVSDFVPEMEVVYWCDACLCDFLMILPEENIGVSVTRAVSYPFDSEFTMEHARALLDKKLYKLLVARNAISEKQSFYKSILHVWCYSENVATNLKRAHEEMREKDVDRTYDNVQVMCTICDKMYIYTNHTHPKEKQ